MTIALESAPVFLALLGAVFLLDWIAISLPRGDQLLISGAVLSAAIVWLGPVEAVIIATASSSLLAVVHQQPRAMILDSLGIRIISIVVAHWAFRMLADAFGGELKMLTVAILTPATLLLSEMLCSQVRLSVTSGRSLGRLITGNLRRNAMLIAAQVSAAALILVTYRSMGAWSLVPVVPLLVLIRQSYSMLMDVEETYRTTLSVLVEAAESGDRAWMGHGERTAAIARSIGAKCGLSSSELEAVGYASLLHDIDRISDGHQGTVGSRSPASYLLRDIGFLSEIVPIMLVNEGRDCDPSTNDRVVLQGFIVALASSIDASQDPTLLLQHEGGCIEAVSAITPGRLKARAVSAALQLGFGVPAITE